MIQLKRGIPSASLDQSRISANRQKNRAAKTINTGLRFKRVFSDAIIAPFDQIEWEQRIAEITDDSGKVIFKQEDIEVPKNWSALATKIAVSKYFYGDIANGTDPHNGGRETSVRQLVHRVTRTITDWGIADGYFADAEAAEIFYDELPGSARTNMARLTRRSGSTLGCITNTAWARARAPAIIFTIARLAKRNELPLNTNIRREAPASSRAWTTRWKTLCGWP